MGIDLDGVVADFNAGWIDRYNMERGTSLTSDLVTDWDIIPSLTHFEHMGQFWRWASDFDGATLFRNLETFPGAVDALWTLAKAGHRIVVVTTKPRWAIPDTYSWIGEHRLPTREVHITNRKWEVECDVYLDDAPANLRAFLRHRPDTRICRFVRPWNYPVDGTIDIQDWDEFVEHVTISGTTP